MRAVRCNFGKHGAALSTVYRREFGETERELYSVEHDHYIEKLIEHDTNRTCWNDRMDYWKNV